MDEIAVKAEIEVKLIYRMGRAPCCDKTKVKRGPWSPEEDATLRSHIQIHGTGGNWIALPHKIGLKRCGKSCRLRWLNYLRPNLRHGGYTDDEDNLICSLYLTIGSRWSIIAAQLPGRTDNDIKNYWNTRLKKKLLGKQTRRRITNKLACHETNNYTAPPPPGNRHPDSDSSLLSSVIMPLQMEANFSYHHHHHHLLETDFHGMYNESMPLLPQVFDGVNGVSVNSSAVSSSFSQIWGDDGVIYPSSYNEEMFDEGIGY